MQSDRAELATLEIPDEAQMRAQLAELTHSDGIELEPADKYEARDPSGSIILAVDKSRLVTEVNIQSGWEEHIRPEAFAEALYTTYVKAIQRALAVQLNHRSVGARSGATPQRGDDPTDLSLDEWISRMRSRLDAIDDEYDAIRRQAREAPPANTIEIRSPLGYLAMSMRGGGPIALTGDVDALTHAPTQSLANDIQQLFARADLGSPGEGSMDQTSVDSHTTDDDYFSNFNLFDGEG